MGKNGAIELLAHTCCGPCAALPLMSSLEAGSGVNITGMFFNPNIQPDVEWAYRLNGAKMLFHAAGRPIIICESRAIGHNAEPFGLCDPGVVERSEAKAKRCGECYRARLAYTAAVALERGFAAFTTTLLISPYQDHEQIASICRDLSLAHGVAFYYRDYRPGFRESQNIAREMGLYRQKYCGCLPSRLEAAQGRKRAGRRC
jgi:predicted adenine nucleotide alpha hydrolase (AANH) superfamily ATPase